MFKAVGSILGRTVAHKAQDKLQAPLWFPVPSALPPQQFHNQQKLQALFDIKKNNNNTAHLYKLLVSKAKYCNTKTVSQCYTTIWSQRILWPSYQYHLIKGLLHIFKNCSFHLVPSQKPKAPYCKIQSIITSVLIYHFFWENPWCWSKH